MTTSVIVAERNASISDRAGDLLLARLLVPTKRPPTVKTVRSDLARVLEQPPSDEQFQVLLDHLRASGLVNQKALTLTESGRERALAFLGIDKLPSRCPWSTIQSQYLVPKALGLDPHSAAVRKRLAKSEALAALLLSRQFELPAEANQSLSRALQALVCKELGFSNETTLDGLKNAFLCRMVGEKDRLTSKQVLKLLPRVLLKTPRPGMDGLRQLVLRDWLEGNGMHGPQATPDASPREIDLAAFAGAVLAVARDCPTGRYGDNKVFINHVWRRLADEPLAASLDQQRFKQHLLEANQAGLLTLSRADLVSVMDPQDIRESEIPYLNAVFHFILLGKEQP